MTTPWQPTGNVHALDESVITSRVPSVSGVYGLHNQHQQLFIGEAANLRETLLLHWQESANLFRGRPPTHFSFEACDADGRAQRAQKLIAIHQPAIQALQLLSLTTVPTAKSKRRTKISVTAASAETAAIAQWPQATNANEANKDTHAKYFSRAQLATVAALFIVTLGVSGFLGVVTGQRIGAPRGASSELDSMRRPILAYLSSDETQSDADGVLAPTNARNPDAQPMGATPASATDIQLPVQVASAASTDGDAETASAKRAVTITPVSATHPATPATGQETSANNWSVQIASTQDQKAAQELQSKLKEKGFDAHIVEADLNSGRWYRLRVGRFGARQEAEAIRQTLQSKENIRSAFVTK